MQKPKAFTSLGSGISRLSDKIKILHRRFNRTIWYKVLRLLFIAATISGIGFALLNLNIFYIQNFEIEGFAETEITYLDPEKIEDELFQYYGQRLFLVSVDEIATSLTKAFPFIQTAYVTKHVPDTIRVRIVERTPILVLGPVDPKTLFPKSSATIYDDAAMIDSSRILLGTCTKNEEICTELPVCLFKETPETYNLGSDIFFAELDEIITLAEEFQNIGITPIGYAVPESKTVVVAFEDTTRAIFSLDEPLEEQVTSFEYTRENLALEGETYKEIDFRYEKPVMRVDKYTTWMTE